MSILQNADKILESAAYEKAHGLYGHKLPVIVQSRLDDELKIIIQHGYSSMFLISQKITQQSHDDEYPICCSGMIGSSLVAFLTGITSVNPLLPHWRCQKCHHSDFVTDGTYASGFDLPNHDCPNCNETMIKDGHDIPYAVLFGMDGSKKANIAIAFSDHEQPFLRRYFEQLIGKDNVSGTETVDTLPNEDTQAYVQVHLGDSTLDILKDNQLDLLKKLGDSTHCSLIDISFDDADTFTLFRSAESPGIMDESWEIGTGMLGIRAFADTEVRQILSKTNPNCFSELVKVSALTYGSSAWEDNAERLIRSGVCTLKDVIASRDDVMMYLMKKGFTPLDAFTIMENVRKGKGIDRDTTEVLRAHDIPEWYINSCQKVRYLISRAHVVSYVTVAYQLAYYKAHYPVDFYRSYFDVHAKATDMAIIKSGKAAVQDELKNIELLDKQEEDRRYIFLLALEMYLSGYTLQDE